MTIRRGDRLKARIVLDGWVEAEVLEVHDGWVRLQRLDNKQTWPVLIEQLRNPLHFEFESVRELARVRLVWRGTHYTTEPVA